MPHSSLTPQMKPFSIFFDILLFEKYRLLISFEFQEIRCCIFLSTSFLIKSSVDFLRNIYFAVNVIYIVNQRIQYEVFAHPIVSITFHSQVLVFTSILAQNVPNFKSVKFEKHLLLLALQVVSIE